MIIRQGIAADYPQLLDIWLCAVRATHHFLQPSDIDGLLPDEPGGETNLLPEALTRVDLKVWAHAGAAMASAAAVNRAVKVGFMATSPGRHRR